MKPIYLVLLAVFLTSCSDGLENIGSISITKVNPNTTLWFETIIELKKGDVLELWNDMSIETKQKSEVKVNYSFEQYLNGNSLGELNLNALKTNPTLLESKEMSRGRMVLNFQGKISSIEIKESGKYTFKAALFTSDEELILNRANLIFKRRNDYGE